MKIEVLFPETANLYGDLMNVEYLRRSCPEIEVVNTALKFAPLFPREKVDLVYLGSMTEEGQLLTAEALRPYLDVLRGRIAEGMNFLVTGNALEVFGDRITADDGTDFPGLGLFHTTAKHRMMNRYNALYVGKFGETDIVGFKSQFGHSWGETGAEPLFQTLRGAGLNPDVPGEGVRLGNFMATYVIGPLLILNPPFAKYVLRLMGAETPALAFETAAEELYAQRVREFSDPATGVDYH